MSGYLFMGLSHIIANKQNDYKLRIMLNKNSFQTDNLIYVHLTNNYIISFLFLNMPPLPQYKIKL